MPERSPDRNYRIVTPGLIESIRKQNAPKPDDVMPDAVRAAVRGMKPWVDERKDLEYRATHDMQTGLLNAPTWKERLTHGLAEGKVMAVVFVDLTNLKAINDLHPEAHGKGNVLIDEVAVRIGEEAKILESTVRAKSDDALVHGGIVVLQNQGVVNPITVSPQVVQMGNKPVDTSTQTVGRLGGDEFGIILGQPRTQEGIDMPPQERVNSFTHRLGQTFGVLHSDNPDLRPVYGFDVAIGSAIATPGVTAEELINQADRNMRVIKDTQHTQFGQHRPPQV